MRLFDDLARLGRQVEIRLILGSPGCATGDEQLQRYSAGDQRQNAKCDIQHACVSAKAVPVSKSEIRMPKSESNQKQQERIY